MNGTGRCWLTQCSLKSVSLVKLDVDGHLQEEVGFDTRMDTAHSVLIYASEADGFSVLVCIDVPWSQNSSVILG